MRPLVVDIFRQATKGTRPIFNPVLGDFITLIILSPKCFIAKFRAVDLSFRDLSYFR